MLFKVLTAGHLSGNKMKFGDPKARERQTKEEHDNLLDITTLPQYQTILAMPDGPQKRLAIAALNAEAELRESEYPKYWNDSSPRRQVQHSSSWVGNVDYDPYSQVMTVELNGEPYTYPNFTPERVAEFLNSDSLGQYLNSIKPWHG